MTLLGEEKRVVYVTDKLGFFRTDTRFVEKWSQTQRGKAPQPKLVYSIKWSNLTPAKTLRISALKPSTY